MTFAACLPIILNSEGALVDDAEDPGGWTNRGITIATLSDWLGRTATPDDIRNLTEATAAAIYQADYYNASHACDCPAGVDLMVFDEATNQGVGRAVRSAQAAAGVPVDGQFGPATRDAVNAAEPVALINAISADRDAFYRRLPTFPHFGAGWISRLKRTTTFALAMAAAALAAQGPIPSDP